MKQFLKNWTLPVAIVFGATIYLLFAYLPPLEPAALVLGPVCETILPLSVFATLFVTFSKVNFSLIACAAGILSLLPCNCFWSL